MRLPSVVTLSALLVMVTGCGFVTTSGEPFRVSEPHGASTPAGNAFGVLAGKFAPVSVDLRHFSETRMLQKYWGGKLLAVALVPHYADRLLVKPNVILPMTSYVHSSQASYFYPAVWTAGVENGVRYRLGGNVKVSEIVYNKTLFAKAGITHTPQTWTAFANDLARLASLNVKPFAFSASADNIESAFLSNGGHLPTSANASHAFNTPAGVETLHYFRTLVAHHLMTLGTDPQLVSDIASGQVAAISATSPMYLQAARSAQHGVTLGVFPFPAGSSGQAFNIARGLEFAMFTHHQPQTQAQEWQFIQWFDSPQQQAYWAAQSGYGPVTPKAVRYISPKTLQNDPGLATTIQILSAPTTLSNPGVSGYGQVETTLSKAFVDAVNGQTHVSQALATVDAAVQSDL